MGFLLALLTNAPQASAQVLITGEIVGTVQDQSGLVVPGAKLQLQNTATKAIWTTTSGVDGGFVFVSLPPGSYDLTATKEGFQTALYAGIVVNAARTTNQTVALTVGKVTQTVEVAGAAPVLQTTTTTISSTVETEALNDLPLAGRAVLPFALYVPGAQRTTDDRDTTFNGLPGGAINSTFDGINNSAQRFKSAGTSFWAFTNPQLESVAEITVSTSNVGGNSAGQGAMQIQMLPKTGTNAFHGELFEQHQNAALNANDWFNDATGVKRPGFILNNFGFALGGPIVRNKLFFFVGYGQTNQPSSVSNASWFLNPLAQAGTFTYTGTDGVTRTANLLQLAGAAGFPSTVNSVIGAQQTKINAAVASVSSSEVSPIDANINNVYWVQKASFLNQYPTVRLDYYVTDKLRLNATGQFFHRNLPNTTPPPFPGPTFKEFSYGFKSDYYIADVGSTWTINPNMTNEVKLGVQSNHENFDTGAAISQFLPECMEWPLGLQSGISSSNPCYNAPWIRNNPVYNLVDSFSFAHGRHAITAGGDVLKTSMFETSWGLAGIPDYYLGIATGDPAASLFTSLPAISPSAWSYAQSLYSLLAGRISYIYTSTNVNENTHQYQYLAPHTDREKQTSFGLYLQDSWRASRSLTLDYGLRWDFQGDDENSNGTYSSPTLADFYGPSGALTTGAPNLFNPGAFLGTQNPSIWQRSKTYNHDYIAPGPHVGVAWNPTFQGGPLKKLFGERKTVFRGGFAINYFGEDMINFQDTAGGNPGRTQSAFLYPGLPGFAPGGLSMGSPLPPFSVFPQSFSFPVPLADYTFSNTWILTDNPNLHAPYVQNWSAGIQRELTGGTVLEVRYVGNRSVHLWHQYNDNEVNIFENGFLKQFVTAQKNLAINQAAGINSFADNTGLTGIAPTPIFDAAFAGLPASTGYADGSFITMLQTGQAGGLASSFAGSYTYLCNLVGSNFSPCGFSGGSYPINFFQLNPYMASGAAQILSDDSWSTYNGLQMDLRHKFAQGLMFDVNYTWSHTLTDRYSKDTGSYGNYTTLRDRELNKCPSPWDIRHTFQAYGTYDLPFGRGRRFSVSNSVLNKVVGGWTAGGIFRVRSGVPFELSSGYYTFNDEDAGVVLPSGVTSSQLQSNVGTYRSGEPEIFFIGPKLIGADGRGNPSFLLPPTTPGQLGGFVWLYGPKLVTTDLALSKLISFTERYRLEFQSEFLNAFNHPDFQNGSVYVYGVSPVSITSTTLGYTTFEAVGARSIQLRLRFLF
jgi:hypothetical protein